MSSWLANLAIVATCTLLILGYGLKTNHGLTLTDEYVYLVGARYFAETGSLDSRYYDVEAILRQGHPHRDHHAPGYMLILAGAMKLAGNSPWAAVGVNAFAYLLGAFLARGLAACLGLSHRAAFVAALLFLVLPAYLAYVFWVLAEVLVGVVLLATLFIALRYGARLGGAVVAAILFGCGFVVRESILFGLPAILAVLRGRKQVGSFFAVVGVWLVLVYAPLVANRAEGGANFWSPAPMPGAVLNVESLRAAREGRLGTAVALAWQRAGGNVRELFSPDAMTEKMILLLYAFLPVWTVTSWRRLDALQRRYAAGLVVGWSALVAVLFTTYTVLSWAGFRYMMFLMPAFVPFVATTIDGGGGAVKRWLVPGAVFLLSLGLVVTTFQILAPFKGMRRGSTGPRQQARITDYVDHYIGNEPFRRVVLSHGFLFGLRHYPVEVVWSTPTNGSELHLLERMIWFDYIIFPGTDPLGQELDDHRRRYQRVNVDDADPPLRIFKRLTGQRHLAGKDPDQPQP